MVTTEQQKAACLDLLDKAFAQFAMADAECRGKIRAYCQVQHFDKGELLHRAGVVGSHVYFICAGLVRFYYITEDGREHNKSFSMEGDFAGAIQYSEQPKPSRFFIQALEPTQTLAISMLGLKALFASSLPWANMGRLYMEALAVRKADREAGFLLDSAERRYIAFITAEPKLQKRLPLYHVASYLGITDVALSRIRRRLKLGLEQDLNLS